MGDSASADRRHQRLLECREHREIYIQYARHRIEDEDWHGVADAACDLRELDVEIRMLEDDDRG